jgi:hypothetical protein
LFTRLGAPDNPADPKPSWSSVSPATVTQFLRGFSVAQERKFDAESLVDYIQAQAKQGELVRWRVMLAGATQPNPEPLWNEDLCVTGRTTIPLVTRTRMKQDPTSMGVVTDPGDELTGLSAEAIAAAQARYREFPGVALSVRQREERDPAEGLLLVYPISPASVPDPRRAKNRLPLFQKTDGVPTIIQYAISFPFSRSDATVEYVSAPQPGGQP